MVSISCLIVKLDAVHNCEQITDMCKLGIEKRSTKEPYTFGYNVHDEIHNQPHWVISYCPRYTKQFLCEAYAPICYHPANTVTSHLPSRQLCEKARSECNPMMLPFGYFWPESLSCDKFPSKLSFSKHDFSN